MRRVVVTGIGVIATAGATTGEFWDACRADRASVAPIPAHWRSYFEPASTVWAPLPDLAMDTGFVSRVERLQLDRSTLLALAATREALEAARIGLRSAEARKNTYALEGVQASRCGVFIGTGIGGITSFSAAQSHHVLTAICASAPEATSQAGSLVRMPPRFNPFIVPMVMPNAPAATVGIKVGAQGGNRTTCQACAAGAIAIGDAFRAVRAGTLDVALAGGAEYLADEYGGIFRGFDVARTLVRACDPPAAANRPFDRRRSGFLFAEGGAAVLVLEDAGHARRRNVPPIAEIVGFGESFEAHSLMAVEPSGDAMASSILTALEDASLQATAIDYVNAHGTGTEGNDEVESAVIERVYRPGTAVNATKSLTGHAIGASGAIEAAVVALSLRDQRVHGCQNLEDPVRPLAFVRRACALPLTVGASHAFGFGGHDAVLVMRRYVS